MKNRLPLVSLLFTNYLPALRAPFPDSWLAAKAHYYRSLIFEKLEETKKAKTEKKRLKELYAFIK